MRVFLEIVLYAFSGPAIVPSAPPGLWADIRLMQTFSFGYDFFFSMDGTAQVITGMPLNNFNVH